MIRKLMMGAAAMALGAGAALAAGQAGHWQVGARVIGVIPSEDARVATLGGNVDIDNAWVPELDFTYYFTDNWAVEVIAGTMAHNVKHTPTNLNLGEVWLLPPTVTLQYHFAPDAKFNPYVGASLNYTIFYNAGKQDPALKKLEYDNAFGYGLAAGFNVALNDNWNFNVDVKKLWLNTDVTITVLPATIIKADVDIDPWIVGIGFNYTFN
jgi:outer membrane protein